MLIGLAEKYSTNAAKFYKKRLSALILERALTEKQPPRNTDELIDRGVEGAKDFGKKTEKEFIKIGNYMESKFSSLFK